MVLDKLKEGVIKPDLYEPEMNPVYRDVPVILLAVRIQSANFHYRFQAYKAIQQLTERLLRAPLADIDAPIQASSI